MPKINKLIRALIIIFTVIFTFILLIIITFFNDWFWIIVKTPYHRILRLQAYQFDFFNFLSSSILGATTLIFIYKQMKISEKQNQISALQMHVNSSKCILTTDKFLLDPNTKQLTNIINQTVLCNSRLILQNSGSSSAQIKKIITIDQNKDINEQSLSHILQPTFSLGVLNQERSEGY